MKISIWEKYFYLIEYTTKRETNGFFLVHTRYFHAGITKLTEFRFLHKIYFCDRHYYYR